MKHDKHLDILVLYTKYSYVKERWRERTRYLHRQRDNKCTDSLFVFYVPSTARSFRDGTPIYCPLRKT